MTLKKSFSHFTTGLYKKMILLVFSWNKFPFSQLREMLFMYHLWKILMVYIFFKFSIVSLTGTVKWHQYCQIQPRVIITTIKYHVSRNYLFKYKKESSITLTRFLRLCVFAWKKCAPSVQSIRGSELFPAFSHYLPVD